MVQAEEIACPKAVAKSKVVLEPPSMAFTYDEAGNQSGEVGRGLKCQPESGQWGDMEGF